jgi:hypothetical protein
VVNQPVAARAWNRLICIVRLKIDLRPAIAHNGICCRLGLAIFWRMILPRCSCLLAGLLPEARLTIHPDSAHGFLCSITAVHRRHRRLSRGCRLILARGGGEGGSRDGKQLGGRKRFGQAKRR